MTLDMHKLRELYDGLAKSSLGAKEREDALVKEVFRQAFEQARKEPRPPPPEPATIHYTELPEGKPGDALYHEWNLYRREAGRLLAEGHEGKFVLIKGEEIIGIWNTHEEARAVGLARYLRQPHLIHQVLTREPQIRLPLRLLQCQG
jgi:hypothetical protein